MQQLCPYCLTGKIEFRKIVFVQPHNADTIVVDRIPALVCSNCGDKTYDPQALDNLRRLLWTPAVGRPQAARRGSTNRLSD
ncbi:MAG: YgiT-type zinc finger protein [Anaerolineae bacterium]